MFDFHETQDQPSSEWYEEVYKSIDAMLIPRPAKDEGRVRYSIQVDDIDLDDDEYGDVDTFFRTGVFHETTFQEMLLKEIEKKNLTPKEFYSRAGMDRKLFSAIKNNRNYVPKKETAIACCLALQCSESKAEKLLRKAGYALTNSRKQDRIISYCFRHQIYDLSVVNTILSHYDEKAIMGM